jgi:putative ABC transport system permease protein
MNFIKRALLSVWKHKVKNLILIVTFSVIAALVYVGICVPAAAQQQVDRAKKTVGSEVTIYLNVDTVPESGEFDPVTLNPDSLSKLSKLSHIQSYNYLTSTTAVVSDGFNMIGNEDIRQAAQESFIPGMIFPNMNLYGALDISKMDKFLSGGYSLYSGRFISPSDIGKPVAMISKNVADKNNLRLRDKIKVKDCREISKGIEFTIIGTYTAPAVNSTLAEYYQSNPVNDVFIPYDLVGLFDYSTWNVNKPYATDNNVLTAMYFLDDPANVSNFINQAKQIIPSDYKIESNDDLYKQTVAPLEKINNTTNLFALITVLAGCLIIGLIIAIFLKGRNFEYGVLLALGEKKVKIIGQTILEVLIPVCLAFCIALAVGNVAAKQIGGAMLKNEVQTEQQQKEDIENTGTNGVHRIVTVQGLVGKPLNAVPIEDINIALAPTDCAKLALASLLIVLISILIPCGSILRFKPRRILASQK